MRLACLSIRIAVVISLVAHSVPANASGHFQEFRLDPRYGGITGIAKGPDGNLWFTNFGIGRISPNGVVKQMAVGLSSNAYGLTTGADGNVWFIEQHKIGKITSAGTVTEYDVRSSYPYADLTPCFGVTLGPDGNVWFTEYGNFKIGRMTPQGVLTEFKLPNRTPYDNPEGIATGTDGNLWFAESDGRIGRLNPYTGMFFPPIRVSGSPFKIVRGADGDMWFDENIGRVTSAGAVTKFADPWGYGFGLASARDGNVWIIDWANDSLDRINPHTGQYLQPLRAPTRYSGLNDIAIGPDGNVWFTESNVNAIGVYVF